MHLVILALSGLLSNDFIDMASWINEIKGSMVIEDGKIISIDLSNTKVQDIDCYRNQKRKNTHFN